MRSWTRPISKNHLVAFGAQGIRRFAPPARSRNLNKRG
jgi:hypothetical protein